MGYCTKYDLEYPDICVPDVDAKIIKALEKINPGYFHYDEDTATYGINSYFDEPMKWYDHDKDMLALSRVYPDMLFTLYGEGEESDDMWITYYKNGKMQHCPAKITYDDFDEAKLR